MALPAPLQTARPVARLRVAASWRPDALAGGAALVVAALLSRPLLGARDLATGAGDWPAHAFRVREVLDHGLTSWSHTWAGGMPLWEGYQALPHLVTAALVRLTGIGVTHAMVLLAGVLLIVLRAGLYVVCRWFGAPPIAALIGALAAMALDTVRQPTANYSELWGLALIPFALYAGYRWSGRAGGFVVAALAGLAVEVHPLLAVTSGLALVAGYLASPRGRSLVVLGGQLVVALAGAAVFWLPVVTSSRPAYLEPYYTSTGFARLLYRLGASSFATGWQIIAVAALLAAVLVVNRRSTASPARYVLVAAAGVGSLVLISTAAWAPEALRIAQLPRLISLVPVLAGLIAALTAARLGRSSEGRRLGWSLAFALASIALLRGSDGSLAARDADVSAADPLGRGSDAIGFIPHGRVLADPVVTAQASYGSRGAVRFGGSYSGREWSILHGPIEYFLAGNGSAATRTSYLVAHAVKYVYLPAGVRPEIVDPRNGAPAGWELVRTEDGFELLRAPWTAPLAWLLSPADRGSLTVADARFRDLATAYARDVATERFARRSVEPGVAADVHYPARSTILVTARGLEDGRYLAVNENWDRGWRATVNGRPLPVERFGLNQIGVRLEGVTGDVSVVLTHHWPAAARAGLAISLLALPVGAALSLLLTRRRPATVDKGGNR